MLVDQIHDVLRTIDDPEMPISIVDLGIVDDVAVQAGTATIRILPTFVGCPALEMLKAEIIRKASAVAGIGHVDVHFTFDPPWTPDRISPAGRADLQKFGVTVPKRGEPSSPALVTLGVPERVACPFCGADKSHLESPFGPTRCRMIYYCEQCKNQFEHMKRASTS